MARGLCVFRQGPDYYRLLVHGFREGHLYLKADVHPDRLSPDPEIRKRAPYLLDAALFQGRYYLYYGVVPAVVLFLPFSLLTGGHDISTHAAVVLFVIAGYGFTLGIYHAVRWRRFPQISPLLDALMRVLLAFGSVTPSLISRSAFYEVPIAAGYTFVAAAIYCIERAFSSEKTAAHWLACASLSLGLAVGCRPNHVLIVPVLLAAVMWVGHNGWRVRRDLALAATLPVVFIGLLLAAYNYTRFHNPFEFGFRYGLNAFFETGKPLAHPSFIAANLRWYNGTPPVVSPYFPFVFPINAYDRPPLYYSDEAVHGQWLVAVLCLLVAGGFVITRWRRPPVSSRREWILPGILAFMAITELAFMSVLGVRANRYMTDFQAPLILLIAMIGGTVVVQASVEFGWRLWRVGLGFMLVAVSIFNLLAGIQQFDQFRNTRPAIFDHLSSAANLPSYVLARLGVWKYGPVRIRAKFPSTAIMVEEPLLTIGTPHYTEVLNVRRIPGDRIDLRLLHASYGGPRSEPIHIDPAQVYTIEIDHGSLYPPAVHRFFSGWSAADVALLKSTVRVSFQGQAVLATRTACCDAPPWAIYIGRNPSAEIGGETFFRGQVLSVERLPPRRPRRQPGLWRFAVVFPMHELVNGQPVLAAGQATQGDLLLTQTVDGHHVRFALDTWGYSLTQSNLIEVEPDREYRLDILAGPVALAAGTPGADALYVWLDGRPVWTTPISRYGATFSTVAEGSNPQGFSTASRFFGGTLKRMDLNDQEAHELLERSRIPP